MNSVIHAPDRCEPLNRDARPMRLGEFLIRIAVNTARPAVQARAIASGRYHVNFDDIRALAHPVLRHRVLTNFHAQSEGITSDTLVDRLLEAVPVPRSGM